MTPEPYGTADSRYSDLIDDLVGKYPDLDGRCGHCQRQVTNADVNHRVTPILEGGRGVECKRRGDYQ